MLRENDLLKLFARANAALPAGVAIPPGDDMAMLKVGGADVLIAVDPLIEGVHFDRAAATIEQIGRKAITRNLSDVAAMAAQPVGAVVAASLPRGMSMDDAAALYEALRGTCARYACPLIGGDTSIWDGPLTLTTTVLAEPAGVEPVRRGTSKAGDVLYVTGQLGHSLAGHHLDFEPRLNIARALAGDVVTRPSAMMDLSDGLAMDLPRLCEHAQVNVDALPVRPGTPDPAWKHAVGDGEDYELLFASSGDIPEAIDDVAITRVGEVTAGGGVRFVNNQGDVLDAAGLGWEHAG